MNRVLAPIFSLLAAASVCFSLEGCMPSPPADDNGDVSFVRQAVPLLLGRKPKGAEEVALLVDIAQLEGREAVVRMLMEQPEFVSHWTDVLVDDLALQREGFRVQSPDCFGDPKRAATSPDLANFISANAPSATAPGGAFNMTDVIRSAIVADDLSAVYRGYAFPLASQRGLQSDFLRPGNVGDAFNHIYLNHQLACFACHNSEFSTTNGLGWDRTFAVPIQLENAVYGANFTDPAGTQDSTYGIFRGDQFSGGTQPWGIAASCGMINLDFSQGSSVPTTFAGASGDHIGLVDLAAQFKSGYQALKTTGLQRTSVPGDNPTVPGDQGYAYMTGLTVAENVWDELMGSKLTIANYYPRNPDQRNTLWNITEFTFTQSGWSLKDLIARIMTTQYFNRRAPDTGGGTTAFRLQMIFDPWVAHDPRVPDPMPDPKEHNNGQGELIHRYAPSSLFHSVAVALGWPEPQRFPDPVAYPNMALEKAIGQYISESQQGTQGVDFQGLLTWESQLGTCQKPAGVGTDWVDQMIAAMPGFDAANPGFPLTLADITSTTKDWLIGDGSIAAVAPMAPDPAHPIDSEQLALFNLYGASLNTTASTVPNLAQKVRRLCGVLLESPRFMLGGIEPSTGLVTPRLRVCTGAPCTYAEMCQAYRATLSNMGHYIDCGNHVVQPGSPPLQIVGYPFHQICPRGDCLLISSKAVLICERMPDLCKFATKQPDFPPTPECGPVSCPAPWFDIRQPIMFVATADGAKVTVAKGVTIRTADGKDYKPIDQGAVLQAGDLLRIPPGAVFEARSAGTLFATPKDGMVSKFTLAQPPIDREFLDAVDAGRLITAQALLKAGASVDARDRYGQTALMKATNAGNLPMMSLLLEKGAAPAAQDSRGLSAADYASIGKQFFAGQLLARKSVFPQSLDALGKAPPLQEAPWLFLVTSAAPPPAPPQSGPLNGRDAWILTLNGTLATHAKDIGEIQELWKKTGFRFRGEAGPLPDAKAAQAAVDRYMKQDFAKEHPNALLKKAP